MTDQPTDPSTCAVRMTGLQWQWLDRVVDNTISVEAENGDPHGLLPTGIQIRDEGWRQIRGQALDGSIGWPPQDDQEVMVSLTGAQWRYAISCLDRWYDVHRSMGETTAEGLLAIRELVIRQAEACLPESR
jgi:hypothetical protein